MQCLSPDPHFDFGGKIYAVGDATCLYDPKTGQPYPAVAPAAIDQGKIAAKNIFFDILGQKKIEYRPREYPYAIPVGGKWAAAKIGPVIITGPAAWVMKLLVELRYLVSVLKTERALKVWLRGFRVFTKND
jgi:NADH dehydrogenase